MLSDYERYLSRKVENLAVEYDRELVHELLSAVGSHTQYWEARYMGEAFFVLLRLIRANPDRLFEDHNVFYDHRRATGLPHPSGLWCPDAGSGMKVKMSKRHPLYRLLSHHFPVGHRVWRYIACGPVPRIT